MTFKEDEADLELLELHLLHGFLGTSKYWSYLDAIQNPKISLIKHEFTQDIKDFKDFENFILELASDELFVNFLFDFYFS